MQQWCIPRANAEYVRALEQVLVCYARPADPAEPVVCLDEYPLALTDHTREPLPPAPGRTAKADYEYTRHGGCALFGVFHPVGGWRRLWVRQQRTAQDFAHILRALVDECFPDARRIHVVLDNLNTHKPSALYATFPAPEAARLDAKLSFVYTPVHGSWVNMMEIEWSAAARAPLRQRLADLPSVARELDAWVARRNAAHIGVRWQFTVDDARATLAHLYPVPDPATTA